MTPWRCPECGDEYVFPTNGPFRDCCLKLSLEYFTEMPGWQILPVAERVLTREAVDRVAVVVVRSENGVYLENLEGFPEDTIQISLKPGQSLEFLDEDDMAENGWVRKK